VFRRNGGVIFGQEQVVNSQVSIVQIVLGRQLLVNFLVQNTPESLVSNCRFLSVSWVGLNVVNYIRDVYLFNW
jgi:hypothetical protein